MEQNTGGDALALTPPEPVAPVPAESASGRVRLSPEDQARLDGQVQNYVGDLTALDPDGDEFKRRLAAMEQLGNSEVNESASLSNRMLERPLRTLGAGSADTNGTVSKGLTDLRVTVESLDPSKAGDLLSPRRLLGMIPFGNKLRAYFDRFQSAQTHLNAIMDSLYRGKDELLRDNAAIEQQKTQMWALLQRLEGMAYLCGKIDAELSAQVSQLETTDPERAKIVTQNALFPIRQKKVDLLTQMAVNVQGYQALDLIKKNNAELVKGVDRATTTTVSALRTAVTTAQALTSQRLVLAQITALSSTTSSMIESTSKMLNEQGVAIAKQASEPTIALDSLKRAFDNVYAAMDAVDDYKAKAAVSLSQTATALEGELDRAKHYLARSAPPQG